MRFCRCEASSASDRPPRNSPTHNTILINECGGKLRIVRNGVLSPTPVPGLPPIQAAGLTGLMDMALHPNFAQNSLIYICYNKPAGDDGKAYGLTLARFRWDGTAISNWQDLYSTGISGGSGGSRIIFGRDGMGKVLKAIAFFDTRESDEFWTRVAPTTSAGPAIESLSH